MVRRAWSKLGGWAGPEVARQAYQECRELVVGGVAVFQDLPDLTAAVVERAALWEAVRKVYGTDTPNYPQEVGSCIGFGMKNVKEYLQCQEILAGDREQFHLVYEPYSYGCSRMVGGFKVRGDGSTGAWGAAAATKYGVLRADHEKAPRKYSGDIDREWGDPPGPPAELIEIADDHVVRSVAKLKGEEDLVTALCAGHPVTVASDRGFQMEASSDGFHKPRGTWMHQMSVVGYFKRPEPHVAILNSWGDVHGRIRDFDTGEEWPVGCLRVRLAVAVGMVKQGDSFAWSQFDGFPSRKLDWMMI